MWKSTFGRLEKRLVDYGCLLQPRGSCTFLPPLQAPAHTTYNMLTHRYTEKNSHTYKTD